MAAHGVVSATGAPVRPGAVDEAAAAESSCDALPFPFTFRPARPLTGAELLAFAGDNSGIDFEVDADGTVTVMSPSKPKAVSSIRFCG